MLVARLISLSPSLVLLSTQLCVHVGLVRHLLKGVSDELLITLIEAYVKL